MIRKDTVLLVLIWINILLIGTNYTMKEMGIIYYV